MNIDRRGLYFILLSQAIWGFSPLIIRLVPHSLPTTIVIFTRFLLGAIVIFLVAFYTKKTHVFKNISKKQFFQLVILGVVGSGMADFFFVEAIRRTGSIVATMIARTEIPLGVLFAGLLLREKLNPRIYTATALSFIGVLLISLQKEGTVIVKEGFYIGVLCAILTAVIYTLAGVYAKQMMTKNVSPYAVALYRNIFAGVFNGILAFATLTNITHYYQSLTMSSWLLLLYMGIFASAFGYITYYKGLERLEASKVSILLSLSTIIALFAGLAAGETLSVVQWAGTAAILAGTYLVVVPAPSRLVANK